MWPAAGSNVQLQRPTPTIAECEQLDPALSIVIEHAARWPLARERQASGAHVDHVDGPADPAGRPECRGVVRPTIDLLSARSGVVAVTPEGDTALVLAQPVVGASEAAARIEPYSGRMESWVAVDRHEVGRQYQAWQPEHVVATGRGDPVGPIPIAVADH